MKTIAALVLAATVALPAAAGAPKQFDLLCSGTVVPFPPTRYQRQVSGEPYPSTLHLRIDLARRLLCIDGCFAVYEISQLGAGWIVYDYDVDRASPGHRAGTMRDGDSDTINVLSERIAVARTGLRYWRRKYTVSGDAAGIAVNAHEHGRCRMAPFSGFGRHPEDRH